MNTIIAANEFKTSELIETGSGVVPETGKMTVSRVTGEEWDAHMSQFDGAAQEQMHVFTSGRWPNVKQEPSLFYLSGELVGGVMIMVQSLPLNVGHIAVAKWVRC